ncbi:MAG: trigger factor [Desulfovibrio sp.]|nr:trigger factor [Desulfovibrio sp.]
MEFTVTELSPIKKRLAVNVPASEVDATLAASTALLRDSTRMDGFRKGKVPVSVIEKKFGRQITEESRENTINMNLNEIAEKTGDQPIAGYNINTDDSEFAKGKDFNYTIEYEILPTIDFPEYIGIEVEETKSEPDPEAIDAIIEKMRKDNAELVVADGNAPARDGQIAVIDFEGFENGEPVKDVKSMNFSLELGARNALEDFEELVKSIPVGHTAEKEIAFPQDFIAPDLAGKTLNMRVKVHAVKNKVEPEFNDEFAKKLGFESAENLRDIIGKSYLKSAKELRKSEAQAKLLDHILKQTEFPVPEGMVESTVALLLGDFASRLEKQGISIHSLKKDIKTLKEEFRPRAEELARSQALLMAIAEKENIDITDQEVVKGVYESCARSGEDFEQTYKRLQETGMIFQMKDKMLADKAMDFLYEKAKIKYVDPKLADESANEKSKDKENTGTGIEAASGDK